MVDDRIRQLVEASSQIVLSTHIEPTQDILQERKRVSIDIQGLAEYLNGGAEVLQKRYV